MCRVFVFFFPLWELGEVQLGVWFLVTISCVAMISNSLNSVAPSIYLFEYFIILIYLWGGGLTEEHSLMVGCGSQRTTFRSQLCLSTVGSGD